MAQHVKWDRDALEQALADAYADAGTTDFCLTISEGNMSAVLVQLHHLKAKGRMSSFSRRDAQAQESRDDCVNIYGYVEPSE